MYAGTTAGKALEVALGCQVDLTVHSLVHTGIGGNGQALGCTGDEVVLAALTAGPVNFSCHDLVGPAFVVDGCGVNTAHEGDFAAVLLDQLGDVVGVHDTLPDVDAHVDHVGHQSGGIGVGVVNDQFHTVGLVVAVDLLVGGLDELTEHGGRQEGGDLAAPVIVMEQSIGLDVLADLFCQLHFEVGDLVNDLLHLIGILIEGHQTVLDLGQVVALLEDAGEHGGGDEVLITVNSLG